MRRLDFIKKNSEKIILNCDKEQLSRVFFNLIKNSIESIHERSSKSTDFAKKIDIAIINKSDYIEFVITDNGVGELILITLDSINLLKSSYSKDVWFSPILTNGVDAVFTFPSASKLVIA